jgi:hypothetical protein
MPPTIWTALARFLKVFKVKRTIMLSQEYFLQWDNTPVNTVASVVNTLAAKGEKMVSHPPSHPLYLPDLAPADFFLFSRVKEKLAGLTLMQESFKNNWEGVVRSIAKEDYAAAFRRWKEWCGKYIRVSGNYVKK